MKDTFYWWTMFQPNTPNALQINKELFFVELREAVTQEYRSILVKENYELIKQNCFMDFRTYELAVK